MLTVSGKSRDVKFFVKHTAQAYQAQSPTALDRLGVWPEWRLEAKEPRGSPRTAGPFTAFQSPNRFPLISAADSLHGRLLQ